MAAETIDRAWIREHATARWAMHVNGGSWHQMRYQVVDKRDGNPIGLHIADTSYKRTKRNGALGGKMKRTWSVDGLDGDCCLEEALELLDCVREAEAHRARHAHA